MGKKSRTKGARGEREWAKFINDLFETDYHRTPLSGGLDLKGDIRRTHGSPKTIIDEWHWEVKRQEKLNVYKALEQAIYDCRGKNPVVAHRRNKDPWMVTLYGVEFLNILKELQDTRKELEDAKKKISSESD